VRVTAPGNEPLETDRHDPIADFSPEQRDWLREQSRPREVDYVPTRSLIPGL